MPAYIANGTAIVFGGGKIPIDFWLEYKGKRILGDGKTWSGFFSGIFFGWSSGVVIGYFLNDADWNVLGFLLAFGAIMGDTIKSFIKRRVGIESGKPLLIFDQLDFVIGAIVFSSWFYFPGWETTIFLIIITPILHFGLNQIAYLLKFKKYRW